MKTLVAKQLLGHDRKWLVIDAEGQNLGRISTVIARKLAGRDRVDYTPHIDNGAYVVVLNAEKVVVTGTKEADKMYYSHSQYMGGLKETNLTKMRVKKPNSPSSPCDRWYASKESSSRWYGKKIEARYRCKS